jgi:ABC-2 type transport system permease protein
MFSALLAAALGFNQFGPEGSGFWLTVAATGSEREIRTDLAGRQLAAAMVSLGWILVVSTVLAVLVAPAVLPAVVLSFGAGAAVLGAGLGVAAVASVLAPYPMPDQPSAAFTGPGAARGCVAGLAWIAGAGTIGALALPVALPALLLDPGWVALVVLLAGPPYGAALAWVGRRIAAAVLIHRMPELLVAVTPDRT